MAELIANTFVTLDGVMQAPGGPDEDREGGFEHGGWVGDYWDQMMGQLVTELTLRAEALLLGRKTYDIFAAAWPYVGEGHPDEAIGRKFNSIPKYVASRTLREVKWVGAQLLEGDVAEAVRRIKTQPGGEIQVHGSANLLQTLIADGLVDEFRVWTFPVVVGPGKRLFAEGALPQRLELTDSRRSTTGVTINTYRPAAQIK